MSYFDNLISYWKLRKIDAKAGKGFLDNPLWKDINFNGITLGLGASVPDMINLYGSGSIQGRAFDGLSTMEQLFGGDEINHDYMEGTDIYFHVHIMPTDNSIGDIKFNIEYEWINKDEVATPPSTISVVIPSGGVAWKHKTASFPLINGTGKKIGSHIQFRLYRNPSDTQDTYSHDVALDSVGIHYQINSLGSQQMMIK